MLAVLVALLTFGGYFTVRTLRTQVRVAQMQSDFVSTVSHEFRSPLAGINQLGEMLRDGRVPGDRRQHYYEMIVAETQRLRRQVENILSFSRMDDGGKPYRLEPLDPTEWLRDMSEEFQGQVAGAGFTIEVSIPDALPAIVADRDPARMTRILLVEDEPAIAVTAVELKLLRALLAHRGEVLTIDQLNEAVWGSDVFVSNRVVYTHMNNLRKKIEDEPRRPRHLITVRGVGYRFDS